MLISSLLSSLSCSAICRMGTRFVSGLFVSSCKHSITSVSSLSNPLDDRAIRASVPYPKSILLALFILGSLSVMNVRLMTGSVKSPRGVQLDFSYSSLASAMGSNGSLTAIGIKYFSFLSFFASFFTSFLTYLFILFI